MSSTRSSSPVDGGSPLGTFLSPKSKMKALLATVGSDSDDESPVQTPKITRRSPVQIAEPSSDSEDEIVRPRGRFAAQMLASVEETSNIETTTEVNPSESARERVRRLLRLGGIDVTEDTQEDRGNDADEDVPVARRRLRPAVARESTPENVQFAAPTSSPGLFVSPGQKSAHDEDETRNSSNEASDDDTMNKLRKNARFQALVERKRKEREAREAEEEAKRAARLARQQQEEGEERPTTLELFSDSEGGNTSSITDDEGGRRLTQKVRPTRRASKRAIEEMNRETQRMARNMQLAHQAKTKKKITKAVLFEKFGFKPAGSATAPEPKTMSSSRPTTPVSDTEMRDGETPPSSPPTVCTPKQAAEAISAEVVAPAEKSMAASPGKVGVPKAAGLPKEVHPKRRVRVKHPANLVTIDSDDELSITATRTSKLDAIFDRVPKDQGQEPQTLQTFRALAQLTSPGKAANCRRKGEKPCMTPAEMQAMLRARARQQAKDEKQRRIEMLKAKGVVVQTEEERLKEIEEVEDIVARAREEAQEIMQREREEAKKENEERRKNGEVVDGLDWDDSSDDEDYKEERESGGEEEPEDLAELELSGSEEEDDGDDEAEDGDDEEEVPNPLFDNEADEDEDEEKEADDIAMADEDDDTPVMIKTRRSRKTQVLSDDDEENDIAIDATPKPKASFFKSPAPPSTKSPAAPMSVMRSATKTFIPGLPVAPAGPVGLGLTQMFAATMDESQSQMGGTPSQLIDTPRPTFDPFARPSFVANTQEMNDDDDVIMDSQPPVQETLKEETQGGMDLHYSQTQMRNLDSLVREETQLSDFMPFTQDGGLEDHTPLKERFIDAPDSSATPATVFGATPNRDASHESPLVRRGRLRRKMDVIASISEELSQVAEEEEEREVSPSPSPRKDEFGFNTTTAFGVMQKAARDEERRKRREEKLKEFNRKKSKAKEMIEEQAEESEDEYAGLGGVDEDDDSDGDLASVKDLIDDEKGAATAEDERKLAAFYADRERADDEKQVEKLFKDITTGMLRRKRANDYDLSDSDDGGEARKRMKRKQFAKMQKALFADERVKKIAEMPGNQAFMRTLEDRASGDEMDFIDIIEDGTTETEDSQSQQQSDDGAAARVLVPSSQAGPDHVKKAANDGEIRPPAHMRRTKDGKKPSDIGQIRESLSSLLDEPMGSVIPATEAGSESDDDDEENDDERGDSRSRSNKENISPPPGASTTLNRKGPVIHDRLSFKRSNSSTTMTGRRAFSRSASQAGKPPTLLRRATSNSFMSNNVGGVSGSSSGTNSPLTTGSDSDMFGGDKIRRGAAKGSSISFERKGAGARPSAAEGLAMRRTERKLRGAEDRLMAARGLLGSGKFE